MIIETIDWGKVYELAKTTTKESFIKQTKNMGKIKELPLVEQFVFYMDKYEKQVFPKLLKNTKMEISPEKFAQIIIKEVKSNPKLLEAFKANPSSMFASILAGAEIGLVPSELLGEFYLIPRKIKQSNGQYLLTVTPLIGYKGVAKILLRSGEIEHLDAQVVYKGDKFKHTLGISPKLEHVPSDKAVRTAENITHVYTVAHYKSGRVVFQVMTKDEIISVKNLSKYNNELYFNDVQSPNRWMEKKTCLIQMSKLLDKDYYGTKAIELDNRLEGGAILTLDGTDKVKLIEGASVRPTRFRDIYGTLGNLEKDGREQK
jgi:phage RecT family recombinase